MLSLPRPHLSALLLLSCLLLCVAVPGQGKRDATLDKLTSDFAAAYSAGNAARVASFYADRAVVMPPDARMVQGRENIEAYYRRGFAQGAVTLRLQPLESAIAGSSAYEAGTSSLLAVRGGAESAGKYVVIYERVRNEWKIVYDIFNNDSPASR
jgi:ketosteroid isomerase-like protein